MAKADYFQRDCAIETLLPGPIYNTLATAADLVQQFIIAEVGYRLFQTRNLFNLGGGSGIADIFSGVAVIVCAYRGACEQIETGLEEASCAESFRRISKNFRPAFSANSVRDLHCDGSTIGYSLDITLARVRRPAFAEAPAWLQSN
jgi:hypothetical protein